MASEKSIDGHRNIIIGDGANAQIEISNYSNSVTKTEVDYQSQFSNLPTDIIPPPSSLPAGSRIEFPVNQAFVGRDSALRQLAIALKGSDATAIGQVTAATGLGGIGKSQLASEFAHRYGQYFAGGVFWLNCEQLDNMANELVSCAASLINNPQESDAMVPAQLIAIIQSAWQEPIPRLLIFDNCEDTAILKQWKPNTGGCRILITSRKQAWHGINTLSLNTLKRTDSIALLIHHRPDLKHDQPELDAIADKLGDLPLALHLAGYYLETYSDDELGQPASYLEALQNEALAHASIDRKDDGETTTRHDGSVSRSFALSYQRLLGDEPVNVLVREILALATCLAAGKPIPRDVFKRLITGSENETLIADAMNRLQRDLGLLTRDQQGGLVLHRLLASFITMQVSEDDLPSAQVEQGLLEWADEINKSGLPALLRVWLPHLQYVAESAAKRDSKLAGDLFNQLGYHLNMEGLYPLARKAYERALKIDEATYGPDHPDVALDVNNLGSVLQYQGDLGGARKAYERALKIDEATYGADHPKVAIRVNNLGSVFKEQGDLEGARKAYERALKIDEATYGPDHPTVAIRINNLGVVFKEQGDLEGARKACERALKIDEATYGPDHPNAAIRVNNLGQVLKEQGDLKGAWEAFERALIIDEATYGPDHPAVAIHVSNLGSVLLAQGDLEGARKAYERALKIDEATYGPDHPKVAIRVSNLGGLLKAQGDLEGAQEAYERALIIDEAAYGQDHPKVAIRVSNLGSVLEAQGDLKSARAKYQKAIEILENVFGTEHPTTIAVKNNLLTLGQ